MRFLPNPLHAGQRSTKPSSATPRSIGIRLENDRFILTFAEPSADGPTRFHFETVRCVDATGFLTIAGQKSLSDALRDAKQRHGLQNTSVAVSLSGDACVTRINCGPTEQVDAALGALSGRVPRYLKLGPGGKVVGQARQTVSPGTEHALTAVGNRQLLESLFDSFEHAGITIAWIEPSLVSLARLVSVYGWDHDHPVLIADSYGASWEVGITHQGRLLLDYRPAAARDSAGFAEAIVQHLSRLRRFCQRHRQMDSESLGRILVGGDPSKVDGVLAKLNEGVADHELHGEPLVFDAPMLGVDSMTLDPDGIEPNDLFAAMASVLPVVQRAPTETIPDLLQRVRRVRPATSLHRAVVCWWPAAAAILLIAGMSVVVQGQRGQADINLAKRTMIEEQMQQAQVRMTRVRSTREFIAHLERINEQTFTPELQGLVHKIAACLPPSAYLRGLRIDAQRKIHLDGFSSQESDIYEIIGYLRGLPEIEQIALLGTTPDIGGGGSQFEIRLGLGASQDPPADTPETTTASLGRPGMVDAGSQKTLAQMNAHDV